MKTTKTAAAACVVLTLLGVSLPVRGEEWSRCISLSHDRYQNSFWANSCGVKLEVMWFVQGDPYGSEVTVPANGKSSIAEPKGRYDVAACPYPQTARDANGLSWSGWHRYHCK